VSIAFLRDYAFRKRFLNLDRLFVAQRDNHFRRYRTNAPANVDFGREARELAIRVHEVPNSQSERQELNRARSAALFMRVFVANILSQQLLVEFIIYQVCPKQLGSTMFPMPASVS
jgi:hypothetical protein